MTGKKRVVVQRVIDLGTCSICGLVHDRCKAHLQYSVERGAPKPCGSMASTGQLVCSRHGGKSPNGIAGGQKRLARERALGEVGQLLTEALGEVTAMSGPEQMIQGINHAGAMALSYRWLLDELPVKSTWSWEETQGPQGSTTRYVAVAVDGLIGPDQHGVQRLHAYEEGFRHWTSLHGRLLKAAADLGLEERRQRFQEDQVRSISTAVRGIVEGLGRDLDDPEVVPIVEAALRVITAKASA